MPVSESRLFLAIGNVVSSWAALEQEIKVQCWELESFHPSGTVRLNRILTSIEARFKFLRKHWFKLTTAAFPEKTKTLNEINQRIIDLNLDRGLVVHSVWKLAPGPVDLSYSGIEQKDGTFKLTIKSHQWIFLLDLTKNIEETRLRIKSLMDKP